MSDLLDRVAATPREELLALVRELERARDAALLRLLLPASTSARLLTPEEASEIASVPVRRIRSWARGKAWARYVGRLLRIDEAGFRAWTAARCSEVVAGAAKRHQSGASDVSKASEEVRNGRAMRLRRVGS